MSESTTLTALTSRDGPRLEEARSLLLEYAQSLDVDLAFQNFDQELAEFPTSYLPPGGALLLATREERLAGSVAMRSIDDKICEMKRLYVRPEFRGTGVGRELAVAIIHAAKGIGYGHMRLDTLPGMDDAQGLYRILGFREIAAYYDNPIPGTRYLELDLGARPEVIHMNDKTKKSEEEWKQQLSPEQYRVTRKKATERPFTGEYHDCKKDGMYVCICCGTPLFHSDHKFDSGTGWPSFHSPVDEDHVAIEEDRTLWMVRTEVLCSQCDAHLGHVFPDGPEPTGQRYCINSAALSLDEKNDSSEE